MILWLPLGKYSWSSGSFASIRVSQALVCVSLGPADFHECCPFIVHGFPLCPCSVSAYLSAFLPCPTLTRKTLLGCSVSWPVPPTQTRSSPPPPRHLLARVGITACAASFFLRAFRDLPTC